MSTTLLEKTRAAHEDIELFERAAVDALLEDPKSHKDNVNQSQWMKEFADKIQERNTMLVEIYEDKDNQRKDEIQAMMGNGQPFAAFYEQLSDIKAYHRKYPSLLIERPEAEQMLNGLDSYENLFTGEEGYGKFLDLHNFFQTYINFKDVPKDLEYMKYLETFFTFPHRNIVRDRAYVEYLESLYQYLIGYFRRSQPLFDIDAATKTFVTDFDASWSSGTFVPIGYNEEDQALDDNPLWCKYSRRLFTNEKAFNGFRTGKNFVKAKKWYDTTYREACLLETKINRLSAFLSDQIEATRENIETKLARQPGEQDRELEENSELSSSSSEEEIRMTKENYPVGWDGNPIPYWLYKLHGLGLEYKCEICGNMSYWGPRAFEKHFQEWRHSHGMKCLRLDNTKEFHHVTKIKDALELAKKLKVLKTKDVWQDDIMEECEDHEGNVMNKKTFMDLRAQGLI